MSKTHSVNKEWEFVSKGTEISLGKFVSEHLTSLTLDIKTSVVSDEDTTEIWEVVKEEVIEKARRNKNRASGGNLLLIDEEEVEKSFCLRRPDDWTVNRKIKKIILLEFKRTTDYSESYYRNMWRVSEQQHTPILTDLRVIVADRGWEVEVVPLVAGQRSVKEKEWLTSFKVFGIGKRRRKEDYTEASTHSVKRT